MWTGILAGPIAWALDLTASYALVQWTCSSRRTTVLHAMAPVALAIVAGGAVLSFIALQRTTDATPTDGGHSYQRARFMAILGLASCALFALTIAAGVIPWWVLDACR